MTFAIALCNPRSIRLKGMKNLLEPRIELSQIDPRTRYFSVLAGLFLALLPLIPLGILCIKFAWSLWWLLIYLVLALVLVIRHANAAHARFGYALLDDGLWLQSGVFWQTAAFVPRERVQHTEVNHGPLDRKMGLAKLVLHTAGLRLQHLTIPGLTDAQAHALRDQLLKRPPPKQFEPSIVPVVPELARPDNATEMPPSLDVEASPDIPGQAPIDSVPENQDAAEAQGDLALAEPPRQIVER